MKRPRSPASLHGRSKYFAKSEEEILSKKGIKKLIGRGYRNPGNTPETTGPHMTSPKAIKGGAPLQAPPEEGHSHNRISGTGEEAK